MCVAVGHLNYDCWYDVDFLRILSPIFQIIGRKGEYFVIEGNILLIFSTKARLFRNFGVVVRGDIDGASDERLSLFRMS